MQTRFAEVAVSVSELDDTLAATMSGVNGMPVAILDHDHVVGYMVAAALYESMIERLEDLGLGTIARARAGETPVPVNLDDL